MTPVTTGSTFGDGTSTTEVWFSANTKPPPGNFSDITLRLLRPGVSLALGLLGVSQLSIYALPKTTATYRPNVTRS